MQRQVTGSQYVKNYEFDFAFGPPWGNCSVTMTSVIGHLYGLDFPQEYRKWHSCRPAQLFDAPVTETIDEVSGPNAVDFLAHGSKGQKSHSGQYHEASSIFQSLVHLDRLRSRR